MDHPRFEPMSGPPDELHRRHHGGRQVALVFAIVDAARAAGGTGALLRRAASHLSAAAEASRTAVAGALGRSPATALRNRRQPS